MSSQFLFEKGVQEVVPYNAQFHFPSQATRTKKTTIKLPPKTAKSPYNVNDIIRFEFPASGYLNPLSVMWELDVYLLSVNNGANWRIQNNISSVVNRAVIKYGSLVLEDIRNYNLLCRLLTELGVGKDYSESFGHLSNIGSANTRAIAMKEAYTSNRPARFLTPLMFGLFQQRKLIPLKWMSSQLIIELYIENAVEKFVIADNLNGGNFQVEQNVTSPTFNIGNTNLIYDLYEFDASYDEAFMEGLQSQGIPLQLTSWHNYTYGVSGTVINAQIQERARSVKMALACLVAQNPDIVSDYHTTFSVQSPALVTQTGTALTFVADSGVTAAAAPNVFGAIIDNPTVNPGLLLSYQYRIGGAYYPAQEVQVHRTNVLIDKPYGHEAMFELQKALDTVGAYQSGSQFLAINWCNPWQQSLKNITSTPAAGTAALLPNLFSNNRDIGILEKQGTVSKYAFSTVTNATASVAGFGAINKEDITATYGSEALDKTRSFQYSNPTAAFAVDLETSNGMEIAGINAEEQSDILLSMKFDSPIGATANTQLQVYTSYDMLLIFRPNNQVEKIS